MKNTLQKYVVMAVLFVCSVAMSSLTSAKELKIGDKAPNFSLTDQNGMVHVLSDYEGQKVALYFYPKEGTPDCTAQACSVRDSYSELEEAGIVVLGLSSGSLKKKQDFAEKHNLSFPLLQTTKKMLKSYGVDGLFFVTRRTFLINEDGIIAAIIMDIDAKHNAQQIIEGFEKSSFKSDKVIEKPRVIEQPKTKETAVVYLHEQELARSAGNSVFENKIKNGKVIVIFYEDWCGPCKRMAPILEDIAQGMKDIVFLKIKRELYRDLFDTMHELYKLNDKQAIEKLTTVPGILFFHNGTLIKQSSSVNKDEMITLIQETYAN